MNATVFRRQGLQELELTTVCVVLISTDYKPITTAIPSPFIGRLDDLKYDCSVGCQPAALMVACSDMGFVVDQVSGFGQGDFNYHQVLGGNVAPYKNARFDESFSSALAPENIRHVVICSHQNCRFIEHVLAGVVSRKFLGFASQLTSTIRMVSLNNPQFTRQELRQAVAIENALLQVGNVLTYPVALKKANCGRLRFHAWVFDDETRRVEVLSMNRGAGGSSIRQQR